MPKITYSVQINEKPKSITKRDFALAIGGGDVETVKAYIGKGRIWSNLRLNQYRQMPLHIACRLNQMAVFETFVSELSPFKLKQILHLKDNRGFSALEYLAFNSPSKEAFIERCQTGKLSKLKLNLSFVYDHIEAFKKGLQDKPMPAMLRSMRMIEPLAHSLPANSLMQRTSKRDELLMLLRIQPDNAESIAHQAMPAYREMKASQDFTKNVINCLTYNWLYEHQFLLRGLLKKHSFWYRGILSCIESPLIRGYIYYGGMADVSTDKDKAYLEFCNVNKNSRDYPHALFYLAKLAIEDNDESEAIRELEKCLDKILEFKVFGPHCSQFIDLECDVRALLDSLKQEVASVSSSDIEDEQADEQGVDPFLAIAMRHG